jgi:hypothetical protein
VKNEKIPPKENWKQNRWFNPIDLRNFSRESAGNFFHADLRRKNPLIYLRLMRLAFGNSLTIFLSRKGAKPQRNPTFSILIDVKN